MYQFNTLGPPTNITLSNIYNKFATITFSATASSALEYNISVLDTVSNQSVVVTNITSPYLVTNLMINRLYSISVISVYTNNQYISEPILLQTLDEDYVSDGAFTNISAHSATVNYVVLGSPSVSLSLIANISAGLVFNNILNGQTITGLITSTTYFATWTTTYENGHQYIYYDNNFTTL